MPDLLRLDAHALTAQHQQERDQTAVRRWTCIFGKIIQSSVSRILNACAPIFAWRASLFPGLERFDFAATNKAEFRSLRQFSRVTSPASA